MMYFITGKPELYKHFNDPYVEVLSDDEGYTKWKDYCNTHKETANDTETTSLDELKAQHILTSLGNREEQFILDNRNLKDAGKRYISLTIEKNMLHIAHHAKYDFKIHYMSHKSRIYNWWCTMTVAQKCWAGAGKSNDNPDGQSYALVPTILRYLKLKDADMDKDIRGEFANGGPVELRHVRYAAADARYLVDLYKVQLEQVKQMNLSNYVYHISRHLNWAVGDTEMEGIEFDRDAWIKRLKEDQDAEFEYESLLDEKVRELREFLPVEERRFLSNGKYDNPRKRDSVQQLDIFGNPERAITNENRNNVNWNSWQQIVEIFAKLKIELPIKVGYDYEYEIPELERVYVPKSDTYKWKVPSGFTTNKKALEEMINVMPDNSGIDIIKLLKEYRERQHAVSTYGYNFIDKLSSSTGKIHTLYRTETATTGRFQSGGGDKLPEKFNSQNIPRDNRFRHCFIAGKDYLMATCDLSGAEVGILCDKAHDQTLYQWAVINDDAHSPIATACWQNIYLYRAGKIMGIWNTAEAFFKKKDYKSILTKIANSGHPTIKSYYEKSLSFTITRTENKDFRQTFKNFTFGTVYGMGTKTASRTLNVPYDEADIALITIQSTIPNTFKWTDSQSEFALSNGYLILNDGMNSVMVYPKVLESLKNNSELEFGAMKDVDGAARNAPIQGTQADMLKEAYVEMALYRRDFKLLAANQLQVHDEMADKFHKSYMENSLAWFSIKAKKKLLGKNFIHGVYPVPARYIPKSTSPTWNKLEQDGLAKVLTYPELLRHTMIDCANRYMKYYSLGAEVEVAPYWLK
jgi:DNA polymerase I-like protein with 3'-5' exonuclease and polymerase domains